jgi:hypothetical protein
MQETTTARIALFVAVAAALVLAAIVFNRGAEPTDAEREASGGAAASAQDQRRAAQLAQADAEVEATARRFLAAFLRYEVGELTPAVRRALRATTTPEFARQLLASPARRPSAGSFPPRAAVDRMNVTFISPQATLAVVDGTALRSGFPEEFGFVFTRTAPGWRASGAAQ